MTYNTQQQKMINRMGTMMISYALISLLMLIMRGWTVVDIVCFGINAVSFVMFQYTNIDKKIIAVISIILGLVSLFMLSGLIIIFGLLLAVYGIILIVKLSK